MNGYGTWLALRGEFGKRIDQENTRKRYRYLIAALEGIADANRMFRALITNGWTWSFVLAAFILWSNLQ